MRRFILLFQSLDKQGIIANISQFVFNIGGNIITLDQHSDENQHFFMRLEFIVDNGFNEKEFNDSFKTISDKFNADWCLLNKDKRLRMGILVSRPDHCLLEVLYQWKANEINVDIPFIISNYKEHEDIAQNYSIPFYYIESSAKDRCEERILEIVKDKTDFLILARYMVILTENFLNLYQKDIINIHHSFLPSFKGANPYKQAFKRGVKIIGATAHFVSKDLDEGPIITQMVSEVSHRDDVADLMRKGKNLEKRAFTLAIEKYLDYKVIKYQNKTIVF